MACTGRVAYANGSEASKNITPRGDAQAVTPMDAEEDKATLLVPETIVSPFEVSSIAL